MSKSEINTDNIIKPSLDDLSDEHRQIYEEFKKQSDEAHEALKKQREEENLQAFLGNFSKGRQGHATPIGEIKIPPLPVEPTKPNVSATFSQEQWAEIESRITASNDL